MQQVADISAFENLQTQAHERMGLHSQVDVFNDNHVSDITPEGNPADKLINQLHGYIGYLDQFINNPSNPPEQQESQKRRLAKAREDIERNIPIGEQFLYKEREKTLLRLESQKQEIESLKTEIETKSQKAGIPYFNLQ